MTSVGVLGCGEVGAAVVSIQAPSSAVHRKDINLSLNDSFDNVEFVHVCIPFTEYNRFRTIVLDTVRETNRNDCLVIIHSSVPPGTCHRLNQDYYDAVTTVQLCKGRERLEVFVHSPVRGVHPHLASSFRWFVKYVGCTHDASFARTSAHLEECGIRDVRRMNSAKTSELAKLMSTTYYGVVLAYHAEMKELCEANGVTYDEAVVEWNESYNAGYGTAGGPSGTYKPNVVRPVFRKLTMPIGGHCVVPNAKLIDTLHVGLASTALIAKYATGQ